MPIDFPPLERECERFPEQALEQLSALSQDYPADPGDQGTLDPDGSIRACVLHLNDKGTDSFGLEYIQRLAATDHYLAVVLDPEVLSLESAKRVCRLFRSADPYFFTHLSRLAFDKKNPQPPSFTTRALAILDELSKDDPIVPWLRQLTDHPDERVRSKAVKVLCRLRPSKSIIELHLKSADPRVRANAVEALWHAPGTEASAVFKSALNDPHHRVVVNALVGLYYRKDPAAMNMIINMSDHPSPKFRLAIIWAMGAIADPRAVPALQKLLSDSSESVRDKAKHVLTLFGPGPQADAKNNLPQGEIVELNSATAKPPYPQVA
jgi:hypothetical protein